MFVPPLRRRYFSDHTAGASTPPRNVMNDNNRDLVHIPYLPTPIITDILSRLSIKTIFNCRLVCKTWAALISTPQFAKLHLSKSPTRCLIQPLKKKDQAERLHLINLECPDSLSNNLVFIPNVNLPNVPLSLVISCNGLLCLHSNHIFVCNPILGEYITIPKPINIEDSSRCRHLNIPDVYYQFAFGFSHITNQYKVLLNSYDNNDNYQTHIYRLGEGSWRSIESVSYKLEYMDFNAFFKGAVHWMGYEAVSPFICCFDFVTEEFRAVPEPSEFDQYMRPGPDQFYVGAISENLTLCHSRDEVHHRVNIWVMKHYGVKESWTKDFVITHTIDNGRYVFIEPIMVNGNGEILIKIDFEFIALYDPKSGGFGSESKICEMSSVFRAFAYVPSLISLKDVAKGENLKVVGRN